MYTWQEVEERVIQKIIPLNRKNYPPRTRFRCRNCTCNCGRRDNFSLKKLSLIYLERRKYACMNKTMQKQWRKCTFFLVVFQKLLFILLLLFFFFVEADWLATHQKLFIHSFLLEISRKRLLLQDWAIKFWLALLLFPESFFFLRSRLVRKIHQHWFIHAFLLATFEKETLR